LVCNTSVFAGKISSYLECVIQGKYCGEERKKNKFTFAPILDDDCTLIFISTYTSEGRDSLLLYKKGDLDDLTLGVIVKNRHVVYSEVINTKPEIVVHADELYKRINSKMPFYMISNKKMSVYTFGEAQR
jgi:hypothetical protein